MFPAVKQCRVVQLNWETVGEEAKRPQISQKHTPQLKKIN